MHCPTLADLPPPPPAKSGWPWTLEVAQLPETMPDGRSWPRISIITPSYNQGHFIEETIRSVLLQGYPDLEYIIMDGGSSDQSLEVIERYSRWVSYWASNRDGGQSDAINRGFSRSTGQLGSWLNSDDLLTCQALRQVGLAFANSGGRSVICGFGEARTVDLSEILFTIDNPPTTSQALLAYSDGVFLGQPSVFVPRQLIPNSSLLDLNLHYVMDLDLWVRLSLVADFVIVPTVLSVMRQHSDAKTYSANHEVYREVEIVLTRYGHWLSPNRLALLLRATKLRRADSLLSKANEELQGGSSVEAWRLAKSAMITQPKVLLSRRWTGFVLRLLLPLRIQRVLLNAPLVR
jgi:glycosyltransferase involved in cell wall biosynthesis